MIPAAQPGPVAGRAPGPLALLYAAPLALLLAACGTVPVDRAPPSERPYADELRESARSLGAATEPAWLALGRWRPSGRGFESEVDGPGFFLAPDGKSNPPSELAATLDAILAPPAVDAEGTPTPDVHALCRFPARTAWLARTLAIDPGRLPRADCPKLIRFLNTTAPRSVTLVFSSYYLNNPASAFGHTFLRLAKEDTPRPSEGAELLDFGIDFSADVDTPNALVYAIKGLTGLFQGTFKRIPYYYKVREYNDYESRDLWSYDLDLTPAEVGTLTLHLWELGSTWFDYWYLSENCSYHILGALEAARPSLELTGGVGWPVIPGDTVRAVADSPGLVRGIRYRPSLRATLAARLAGLDDEERELALAVSSDPALSLADAEEPTGAASPSPQRQAAILDAAMDLNDVRHASELVHEGEGEGHELKQALLARRASLGVPSPDVHVPRPEHLTPHLGHGTRRIGAATTFDHAGLAEVDVRYRMALHDLADPAEGYPDLAQLEFLPIRLGWRLSEEPRARDLRVEADLVRIVSLTALDRLELMPSWNLGVGVTTVEDAACPRCLAGRGVFGGGFALTGWRDALTLYLMADATALWGPGLGGIEETGLRAGAGPTGGLRFRLHPRATLHMSGSWLWMPWQAPRTTWRADAALRWLIAGPIALSLEARWTPLGGARPDATAAVLLYY